MKLSPPTHISIPHDDLVNLYEELGKKLVESLQRRGIFKTDPLVLIRQPAVSIFSKWFQRGAKLIRSVTLPQEGEDTVQLSPDGWLRLYSQLDSVTDILLDLVNQDEAEPPMTRSQLLDHYGHYIVRFMENWYGQLVSHTDSAKLTSGQARQLACQYNSGLVYRLSYIQFFRYETVTGLLRQAFGIPCEDSEKENPHTLVEMMEVPGDISTCQSNPQYFEYALEESAKNEFGGIYEQVQLGTASPELLSNLSIRSVDDEVDQLRSFFRQKSCVQTMAQLCAENPLKLESIEVSSLKYQYNTLLRNHPTIFTKTSIPNLNLWGLLEWQSQWKTYASYSDLLEWMKGLPKKRFYNATELLFLRREAGLLPALIGLEKDDQTVVSLKKVYRNMLAEAFSAGKLQRKTVQGVYCYHLKQTAITRKKTGTHFSPDQFEILINHAGFSRS